MQKPILVAVRLNFRLFVSLRAPLFRLSTCDHKRIQLRNSRFSSLARSKPTTTSPSITVTGVVITELFKFRQRGLISCDISFGVLDLVLRKKLFHFSAKHSAGLAVHDDFSTHENPP